MDRRRLKSNLLARKLRTLQSRLPRDYGRHIVGATAAEHESEDADRVYRIFTV